MPENEGTWTVQRLLEWTTPFFDRKGIESSRLSAELLLAHVLGVPRIKLYTDYQRAVGAQPLTAYRELVRRAAVQEPVAYLTGKAHFFNLEFIVSRDVLIPRPDTETLVENVIQLLRLETGLESPRILDLCTGSGCIAASIAQNVKTSNVIATDISPAAVAIARQNVEKLGLAGRVSVLEGDLFNALESMVDRQPFHLIVSNPPYIATGQIAGLDRSVKDYEPVSALDGGLDGLVIHRRILKEAPALLLPGGQIFLEIAFDQGALAKEVAAEYPAFERVRILKDYAGNDRVLAAKLGS
ncbi:MAG: peptide chain release factor N(5)-glutamine methyltransferase [Planctomycetota bacterium]|nr:peptide chain release factor N(5)-glutamine methyltransferase [Planctomycetota bacterium]